jgi:hypothetical protein
MPDPLRLADLDPRLIAADVMNVVYDRVYRDARRIGLVVRVAEPGQDEKLALATALGFSEVSRSAHTLAEWATSGLGQAAEITPRSSAKCVPTWKGSTRRKRPRGAPWIWRRWRG